VGDGAWAATAEVFKSSTVIETVLEEVDDFFDRDIDYCGTLSHPILQGKPNASHMCARIIYTHMIDKTRVIPLL
jgi:hypothetical protein